MTPEKEHKLLKKYPKIFDNVSEKEPISLFGIECGDGWYDLIDNICEQIQKYTDENGCSQPKAEQIKEKFGELRFYVSPAEREIYDIIDKLSEKSNTICEICGAKGETDSSNHWLITRCEEHKRA